MLRKARVKRLFPRSTLRTTRFERTCPRCSNLRGTPRQLRRLSRPGSVAPTSTKKPMSLMRRILPSTIVPSDNSSTGTGGGGSAGFSSWPAPCRDASPTAAERRPPRRPSDRARGTISRQLVKTPEGEVDANSKPSEWVREKRQQSKYSEMVRGMIKRAVERRMPRFPGPILSDGALAGLSKTAGNDSV